MDVCPDCDHLETRCFLCGLPVRTVEGEPLEVYAFMGTSRLEEPLNRYPLTAVFHGHAHHGSLEGQIANNVPVYNVSLPLLRAKFPDQAPFRILEIGSGGLSQ